MNFTIFAGIQRYIGLFDILIIFSFGIIIFLGYKKGFLEKFLNIVNALCGFVFAILFSSKFAKFIGQWLHEPISGKIQRNIEKSSKFTNITITDSSQGAMKQFLESFGVPKFLSSSISKKIDASDVENLKGAIAESISDTVTNLIMVIIAFIFLFIGITVLIWILKIIVKLFRHSKHFKRLDGFFGIIFYMFLNFVVLTVLFFIMSFIIQVTSATGFSKFVVTDMRLGSSKGVGIARWFYEYNIIGSFFELFF